MNEMPLEGGEWEWKRLGWLSGLLMLVLISGMHRILDEIIIYFRKDPLFVGIFPVSVMVSTTTVCPFWQNVNPINVMLCFAQYNVIVYGVLRLE